MSDFIKILAEIREDNVWSVLKIDEKISFWYELDDLDTDDMQFQHKCVSCHKVHTTMDILHKRFEDTIISHLVKVRWPPRSCFLTAIDFFL